MHKLSFVSFHIISKASKFRAVAKCCFQHGQVMQVKIILPDISIQVQKYFPKIHAQKYERFSHRK